MPKYMNQTGGEQAYRNDGAALVVNANHPLEVPLNIGAMAVNTVYISSWIDLGIAAERDPQSLLQAVCQGAPASDGSMYFEQSPDAGVTIFKMVAGNTASAWSPIAFGAGYLSAKPMMRYVRLVISNGATAQLAMQAFVTKT